MIRQPTQAEILAVLNSGTPTLGALRALTVVPTPPSDNDAETAEVQDCIACRRCRKSRSLRNCVGLVNCTHCTDCTWLGGALEPNGCHYCISCHGVESAPAQRLYGCSNLHGISRAFDTHNLSLPGEKNFIFGVQVVPGKFDVVWDLVLAEIAAERAAEGN